MPKKAPKNAYYYFMREYMMEQNKQGRNMKMNDANLEAGPIWSEMPPPGRAKYVAIAKAEKEKRNIPEAKYTSLGQTYEQLDNQERALKEALEMELKDIQNFVEQNTFNNKILDKDIYVIDVNSYCETNEGYLTGECTILRFTVRHGIKDFYHVAVNPGKIPIGYASSVKLGCEEFCLEYPDMDNPVTDLIKFLAYIVDYLTDKENGSKLLAPLFTLPEKLDQVQDFISKACYAAVEDFSTFRIYKLDLLYFYLINGFRKHINEGFPKESLALAQLRKDPFKYTPHIGCPRHEAHDKTPECTLSRVHRWAYTVLDGCCPVAGVSPEPGRHVPPGLDLQEVLATVDRKRAEHNLPEARAPSSLHSAHDASSSVVPPNPAWSKPVRSLQPLRKPSSATMAAHSAVLAPDLSESDFPSLPIGAGRGSRQRTSLTKSLNHMNLEN